MLDKSSGKVVYAILSFGGFLGIGDKHLPIPWTKLTYDHVLEAYQLELSDDVLKKAPSYDADKEFDWGDRSQENFVHSYYSISPYWLLMDSAQPPSCMVRPLLENSLVPNTMMREGLAFHPLWDSEDCHSHDQSSAVQSNQSCLHLG